MDKEQQPVRELTIEGSGVKMNEPDGLASGPGGVEPEEANNDVALCARVVTGDREAFSLLYDRYVDLIYGLALYMVGRDAAEEAVQDVFLRLWTKRVKFEPSRGAFRSWLMAVARHHFLDLLRRRGLEQRIQVANSIDSLLAQVESKSPDPESQVWYGARALAVREALRSIPAEQRQVIVLAYFAGLSQSAIARQLESPLGTVKKRVKLGMQKLRSNLTGLKLFEEEARSAQTGKGR